MRTFTSLYIAFVLLITTNAASIDKRKTSASINECVGLTDDTKAKFDALSISFVDYSNSIKPSGLEIITNTLFGTEEKAYKKLQADSKAANDVLNRVYQKCCPIPSGPTKGGERPISEAFKDYSLAAIGAFDALKSKASVYDKNGGPYKKIRIILHDLGRGSSYMNSCFLDTAPQAERGKIAEYKTKVNNAFEAVFVIFNGR